MSFNDDDYDCMSGQFSYRHLWINEKTNDYALYELTNETSVLVSVVDTQYKDEYTKNGLIYLGWHKCRYVHEFSSCLMIHKAHIGGAY